MSVTPVSDAWLVTAFPLWMRNGYSANVMSLLEADGGERIRGVLAIVPLSLRHTAECEAWVEAFSARPQELVIVEQPPDLGTRVLRALSDAVLKRRVARELRSRAAIVHARGIRAGAVCASVRDLPVVLDVRGDAVAEARLQAGQLSRRRASNLLRWSVRETERAFERADAFIVVSDAMADWLEGGWGSGGRTVSVMSCPVDVDAFRLNAESRSERLKVCYLGGLQAYQGPKLVADAFARLADADESLDFWVLTGDDAGPLREALAERGLTATVESLEFPLVAQRLCEADVGIVPREPNDVNTVSCPTKIGEYLSAGLPVLISRCVGGWPSLLSTAGVGGALDGTTADLTSFLTSVRAGRDSYRDRARSLANDRWSWQGGLAVLDATYSAARASMGDLGV